MFVSLKRNHQGSYRTRIDEVTIMLDHKHVPDNAGSVIEADVMLTRALFPRNPESGHFDYSAGPYGYLCRLYSDENVLVRHKGFECIGTMCATTASAQVAGIHLTLTPGRMHGGGVYVADNVNTNFCKSPPAPLVPGSVFVNRESIRHGGIVRSEGLPDLESTAAWITANNPAVLKHVADMKAWQEQHDAAVAARRQQREAA